MREYLIKFEDHTGEVHTIKQKGYSEEHAISKLYGYKEIYWIK